MGISGIQYAKLSGYRVIATSSPHNFDYLKSLGADEVYDYKSPTVSEDIRKATNDELTLAWDCQSTNESVTLVAKALSSTQGGVIGTLLPVDKKVVKEVNDKVEVKMSLYYTVFGEEFGYFGAFFLPPLLYPIHLLPIRTLTVQPPQHPFSLFIFKLAAATNNTPSFFPGKRDAVPENYEFGKKFWEISRGLLAEGKLKPIRVVKNQGGSGLEGVVVGLKELKEGKVSAGKLVYTI